MSGTVEYTEVRYSGVHGKAMSCTVEYTERCPGHRMMGTNTTQTVAMKKEQSVHFTWEVQEAQRSNQCVSSGKRRSAPERCKCAERCKRRAADRVASACATSRAGGSRVGDAIQITIQTAITLPDERQAHLKWEITAHLAWEAQSKGRSKGQSKSSKSQSECQSKCHIQTSCGSPGPVEAESSACGNCETAARDSRGSPDQGGAESSSCETAKHAKRKETRVGVHGQVGPTAVHVGAANQKTQLTAVHGGTASQTVESSSCGNCGNTQPRAVHGGTAKERHKMRMKGKLRTRDKLRTRQKLRAKHSREGFTWER